MRTAQSDGGRALTEIPVFPHINPAFLSHHSMSLYLHLHIRFAPDISNQEFSPLKAFYVCCVLAAVFSPLGIKVTCGFWATPSASQTESHPFHFNPQSPDLVPWVQRGAVAPPPREFTLVRAAASFPQAW